MSLIHIDDIKLTFNSKNIEKTITYFYSSGPYDISIHEDKRSNLESFILTKGIPFSPLINYVSEYFHQYVVDHIRSGILLNIKHGGYTPVQTRTKIIMSQNAKEKFVDIIICL